ncbi:hypothetical protein Hypma_007114 [Hypsizygus marmoreus]|uniref:Uncharacterized protein n=1 Tax=Hypsizygus marmoreus TaxID=39966 RepID=A0A369KC95_HYPMA|nr:hypothetical protein Hypma_007114 [Hypsizygus marmoreus]
MEGTVYNRRQSDAFSLVPLSPRPITISPGTQPAPTSLRTSSVALAFTRVYDPNAGKAEISKVLFPALAFDVREFSIAWLWGLIAMNHNN